MASSEQSSPLNAQLQAISQELLAIAAQHQGDGEALLAILRQMEQIHREISEQYFYPSLPERRRDLYNLLRDIETEGGWPYIARPKLEFLLHNFLQAEGLLETDTPDHRHESP